MPPSGHIGFRMVSYLTEELETAHGRAVDLLIYEMQQAMKREDLQCASNLNAVLKFLSQMTLSWHGGRDLGILEAHEQELNNDA